MQHTITPINIAEELYIVNDFLPREKFEIIYKNVLSSEMTKTVCSIRI